MWYIENNLLKYRCDQISFCAGGRRIKTYDLL